MRAPETINSLYVGNVIGSREAVRKPLEWISVTTAIKREWCTTNGYEDRMWVARHVKRFLEDQPRKTVIEKTGGDKDESLEDSWLTELRGTKEWFEQIESWSRKLLGVKNLVVCKGIESIVDNYQTSVMRCKAKKMDDEKIDQRKEDGGERCEFFYIKYSVPVKRHGERTLAVAGIVGDIMPEIIGVDKRAGVIMQRDVGKVIDEVFCQEDLINTILEMQELSLSRIQELEKNGLRVRDSEWVEANVESILNHRLVDEYVKTMNNELCTEMVEEKRSDVRYYQEVCRMVTKLGLPNTIVHGDMMSPCTIVFDMMSLRNIGSPVGHRKRLYRIFDWEKCFIGNPLHDLAFVFGKRPINEERNNFGSEFPGLKKDWDGAMKRICKMWKPCGVLSVDEMNDVVDALFAIAALIEVDDLTEQFDLCDESDNEERELLIQEFGSMLELI